MQNIVVKFNRCEKNNVVYLMILFITFLENVSRIYIFGQIDYFANIIDIITLLIYLILVIVICFGHYNKNELLLFLLIGILLCYNYYCSGQAGFLKSFLIIIACRNLDFKRICNSSKKGYIGVVLLALILYVTGLSTIESPKKRTLTLGFGHPNVTAQFMMLIFLLHASEHYNGLKKVRYGLYIIGGIVTFLITRSKTSSIVIISIPFVISLTKHLFDKPKFFKISKFVLTYNCMILFVFSYLSAKYLMSSGLLIKLNSFFTGRIWLNYWLINNRDITLFGQNITMTATGIHNTLVDNWNVTITCDNSYITWLLRMGIVPSLFIIFCNILLIKKAIKNKEYGIIAINFLLTVYAFDEAHLMSITTFFMFYYLANGISVNQIIPESITLQKNMKC